MNILSWNIHNKKTVLLTNSLQDIISENRIDIIILQEAFGTFINTILSSQYDEIPYPGNGLRKWVRIFIKRKKFKYYSIKTTNNNKLVFVHLQTLRGKFDFNIAGVHLYSKVGNTNRKQMWKNHPIIESLKDFERNHSNNSNTIVIGDFNHNPYEINLTDPYIFNCLDSRSLINLFSLYPVTKYDKDFWYNPMWNLLGDHDLKTNTAKTPGTYYRYTNDENSIWNMLDGFILRPSLMDRINFKQTFIIDKTKNTTFLKSIIVRTDESIIKDDLSDHLPIKLNLKII